MAGPTKDLTSSYPAKKKTKTEKKVEQGDTKAVRRTTLTLLEPQSRCGDKSVKFQGLCPQNGTAVRKGLSVSLATRNVPLKGQEHVSSCISKPTAGGGGKFLELFTQRGSAFRRNAQTSKTVWFAAHPPTLRRHENKYTTGVESSILLIT